MQWINTIRHQTILSVDGELFSIVCEDDGAIALSINGSYVRDLEDLPTSEELTEVVREFAKIEEMADAEFNFIRGGHDVAAA